MTATGRRRRRRTGRIVVTAAAVLVFGAAAGAGLGFDAGLRGERSGDPASGLPPATATVARQTLVDTETKTGELSYGDAATLTGRLAGTVTAMPAAGAVIERGEALHRVDDTPVVLLYGKLPAYRTLSPGIEGADVKQFERNLYALGYRGFTVNDEYTNVTAEVVREWQDDLGLPETGTVELGRVVYAAGPVRVDTRELAVGDPVQPQAAVLTHTGTARTVTVELDVSEQRLARKGAAVRVTLPDGTAVTGKIAATKTVVGTGDGGGPESEADQETKYEVTVTIKDQKALADLDQAAVQVAFTAAERTDVLTVPVAALLALAEGGYGVEVVEGRRTRIVAVETGLFAGGRVEITGEGLTEGMTVGMPS